jgi:hypothetical protein
VRQLHEGVRLQMREETGCMPLKQIKGVNR